MKQQSVLSSRFRSVMTKLVKEECFIPDRDFSTPFTQTELHEKYKSIINNSKSFFIICNYRTALYEYVSENIKDHLGYDIRGYSPEENTNLIISIIHEKHLKFMFDLLLPVVLNYFKEHATQLTGTDYRYTCCFKARTFMINTNGI